MEYLGTDFKAVYRSRGEGKLANYDQITEQIFLGAQDSSENLALLKDELKVAAVVRVGKELKSHFPNDFEYLEIGIWDESDEDIRQYFSAAIAFIDKIVQDKGKRVLVHCAMGVSRSATIVIAYLMHKEGISLMDAFRKVKERRPCIEPNRGFQSQLIAYEAELFDKS